MKLLYCPKKISALSVLISITRAVLVKTTATKCVHNPMGAPAKKSSA